MKRFLTAAWQQAKLYGAYALGVALGIMGGLSGTGNATLRMNVFEVAFVYAMFVGFLMLYQGVVWTMVKEEVEEDGEKIEVDRWRWSLAPNAWKRAFRGAVVTLAFTLIARVLFHIASQNFMFYKHEATGSVAFLAVAAWAFFELVFPRLGGSAEASYRFSSPLTVWLGSQNKWLLRMAVISLILGSIYIQTQVSSLVFWGSLIGFIVIFLFWEWGRRRVLQSDKVILPLETEKEAIEEKPIPSSGRKTPPKPVGTAKKPPAKKTGGGASGKQLTKPKTDKSTTGDKKPRETKPPGVGKRRPSANPPVVPSEPHPPLPSLVFLPSTAQPPSLPGLPPSLKRFPTLEEEFIETRKQVNILREKYRAGEISYDELQASLRKLTILDSNQVWWMLGIESNKWYRYDSVLQEWIEADPPVPLPPEEEDLPSPPVE